MATSTFDEFVKSQQEPVDPDFWRKQRDEWLGSLDDLYSRLRNFLDKYISSGLIQFELSTIELDEENIGAYQAPMVNLRIGRRKISLQPIGTLLIGSKGRVDVVGPTGTVSSLVLVNAKARRTADLVHVYVGVGGKPPVIPERRSSEIKWEWRMVTRPPERRFVEITQESFFEMIMEVANG